MTTKPSAYRLTLHVAGVGEVVSDLPETGADKLAAANRGIAIPPDEDEALAIARMIYTLVLFRMDKGTGFYQTTDTDGRQWVFRADHIIAFSVAPTRPSAERRLGFDPLARVSEK
jgi:hypothetical protein